MEDLATEVTVPSSELVAAAATAAAAVERSTGLGAESGAGLADPARLFGSEKGRRTGGYRAPLVARVHLRLGIWRWGITDAEVHAPSDADDAVLVHVRSLGTYSRSMMPLVFLLLYWQLQA